MLDLAAIKFPILRVAYKYWLEKAADGRLPNRFDLKPKELRALLPYVFLIDVPQAPLSFKFRLVGTQIVQWAGADHTGLILRDGECGPNWQDAFNDFRDVVHMREPRRYERQAPWISREFYRFELIVTPLSTDGTTVDMLFGALHVF